MSEIKKAQERQQPQPGEIGDKRDKGTTALNVGETYNTKTYALARYLDENEKAVVEDLLEKYFYGEASVERDWLSNEKTPEKLFDRFFERMAPQEFLMAMEECRRYFLWLKKKTTPEKLLENLTKLIPINEYLDILSRYSYNL